MATSDPLKPTPAATEILRGPQDLGFEADFADLAARFAAKSGGGLSAELSAELALEIVLNEIVEQACQITGATGSAIVLDRDGELICRASSGSTAPELGSRIEKSTGLACECLSIHKTLWCDDTFTDPRANSEPLKQSGVRSVVMMPLLRDEGLVGIFELFSSEPYAFGVRDERTLEILAERTITNLDHASQSESQAEPVGAAGDLQEEDLQKIGMQDVNLQNIVFQSLSSSPNGASRGNAEELPAATFPPRDMLSPNPSLPNLTTPNPNRANYDFLSSQKSDAKASREDAKESDSAFPDFDPAEISPEKIHALLENAGVIAPQTRPAVTDPILEKESGPAAFATPFAPAAAKSPSVAAETAPPKQVDYVSWALGFAVVSVAVLLGLVLGQHFVLSHSHVPVRAASATQRAVATETRSTSQTQTSADAKPAREKSETTAKNSRLARSSTTAASHEPFANSDETVPPGGLLVFQNGKEVFRLPPGQTEPAQTAQAQSNESAQQAVQPASDREADSAPKSVVDVPEATAQRELLRRVEPEYPEAARDQNIQGPVVLEVHIGTDGSVENVDVVSGPQPLAQASTDAVKQWKFKPRVVNGRPVEMQTRVTFDFKLPQ